ncbi:FAD-binding oxidoreductase [Hoeflea prorocentri]|uniref:FAD-binding oxidoreductase n=1 Tax=Hoeflea prorocentri TaxID=1922333 RepID=A0A9X3UGE1_9HYPH|nr:FAD-binding oxidoreductase [Hoeflea prorocentri]MCY6380030.1 FAD-binding oxidoreductase [Hoeflea prorocentri]MDA5397830.1 FAD-binding oxidoreductase [Hoeflea prorocentri]
MSYDSWGSNTGVDRAACAAADVTPELLRSGSFLPFGNGRSYGDSCHNDSGRLIDSRNANRILGFDEASGALTCEAGTLLSDVLAYAIPRGYFLPVTPGTRFVTVGGAIANDVHGKNHHRRGTFGCHVARLTLVRSDGGPLECSPTSNSEMFSATIGGMGLTGLIMQATIRLMRVGTADVRQRTLRFGNLDDYFKHCDAFDAAHEYAVAWIDQLARGRKFGRGLLLGGDHIAEKAAPMRQSERQWLQVPFTPPISLLNRYTLAAFNELFFRKEKVGEAIRTVPWQSYFYPLDSIGRWNRLYGPRGLFQHQSVYPQTNGSETTAKLMECAQAHGHASFLTVLKKFGSVQSPGLFSFPRPGFTLTLDFANQGKATLRLLDALDDIVVAAGGAVNPYKDARMGASVFEASFPDWHRLENLRDPAMMSDFWRRTAMVLASPENTAHLGISAKEAAI